MLRRTCSIIKHVSDRKRRAACFIVAHVVPPFASFLSF
jgi:hypothetical protein